MGNSTTASRPKPTKPSGWKGKKDDAYWHKSTTFGVRSMCSDCGKETRGWGSDRDRRWHWSYCPRIAGPRKEWKGYVDVTGKVCVHRLTVDTDGCFETSDAALRALDLELSSQMEMLSKQREQVAVLLAADDTKAGE